MTTAKSKKLVMVGRKTLMAPLLKEDPIREGETLTLSGKALEYALNRTYSDTSGVEHNMFVAPTSAEAKRATARVDNAAAQTAGGRRRRRSA